jgi:GNAT superfamily N-acetyltransferase
MMIEPQGADYIEWRMGIPLRPSAHRYSHRSTAASARQLSGFPAQFAGLPGQFLLPLFLKRMGVFHRQQVHMDGGDVRSMMWGVYESLWSPDDLSIAMYLDRMLMERGVEFGLRPIQDLVVQIFPSIYDAPGGTVPLPDPEEHSVGDHAVMPIGVGNGRIFFQHSWGTTWGDNGVGSFSREYVNRFQREAWSERVRAGPKPGDLGLPIAWGPNGQRFAQLLSHPWKDRDSHTKWELLYGGATINVLARWLIGVAGNAFLQCVALLREAEGGPLVAGWMHISGTLSGADVEELFVWPPYRECGIGTALAGHALLYITKISMQDLTLTWHEQEADATVRQHSPLKPHVPHWLQDLPWRGSPGAAIVLHGRLLKLLRQLVQAQVPDGIRVVRSRDKSAVVDVVVHDERYSAYYGVPLGPRSLPS